MLYKTAHVYIIMVYQSGLHCQPSWQRDGIESFLLFATVIKAVSKVPLLYETFHSWWLVTITGTSLMVWEMHSVGNFTVHVSVDEFIRNIRNIVSFHRYMFQVSPVSPAVMHNDAISYCWTFAGAWENLICGLVRVWEAGCVHANDLWYMKDKLWYMLWWCCQVCCLATCVASTWECGTEK